MESDNAFDSSSFQRGSHYSGGNNASSSSSSRRWKRPRSRSRSRSRRRRSRSRSRSRHDRRERNSSRSRRDNSPSAALRTHHRTGSSSSTSTTSSSSAKRYSAPIMFQFPFHRYTEAPDSDYSCWLCGALNLQTHGRCEHCDAPFISEPFRPYFEGLKRKGAHSNQGVLRSVSGVGFVRQLSTNFISQEDRESLLLHAFHALVASTPAAVETMVQTALIQLSSTTHHYGAAAGGGSRSGELTPLVELLTRAFAWTLYHHRGVRFKDEAERLQELSTALFDAEHRLYDVREIPVCRKRRMMPSSDSRKVVSDGSSSVAEPEEGVVVVFTFASVEGAIHAAKNTRCSVVASPNVPHRLPLSFVVEQGGRGSVLTSTFPPITKTVESSSSDSRSNPQLAEQLESVAVVVAVPPLVEVANAEATFPTVEAEWAYLNSLYDVWEHLTPAHKSFYDARLPVVQQKRREAEAAAAAPVSAVMMTAVQTAKDRGNSDGPVRQQSDASTTPEKEAAAAGGSMTLQERLAKKKADLLAAKAFATAAATGSSSSEAPSPSLPQTSAGSGTASVDMSTTLAVASVKERLALLKAQRHNSHAASATDSAAAPPSSAVTSRQEPGTSSSGLSSVSSQQQQHPHTAAAAMSTWDPLTSQLLAWGGMESLPSEWGPIFGDPSTSLAASAPPTLHGAPVSSSAAAVNYEWTFSGIHPEVGARCLPRHVRPVSLTRADVPDHA